MGQGEPRLIVALAAAALLLAAAPASAQECDPVPAQSYETGGAPAAGAPVNDPLYPRQWALEQIHAAQAWKRGFRGRGSVIAILDTGIDQTHPDLLPGMLPGADLVAAARGAPDCPAGPEDELGHGTHVAGIAGARGGNGTGVAGVAPEASILPLKVGDEQGPSYEAVLAGIRLAADRGADVMNISLHAGNLPYGVPFAAALEPEVEAAVKYAWDRGTVVVAAAGNSALPQCDTPASASLAVCVTASDRDGLPAAYSNGSLEPDETVVLRAPGGNGPGRALECDDNVLSTYFPAGTFSECPGPRGYATMSGTSMAAPHVTGLVALLASAGLTAPEIVERLQATTGQFGIVDAAAATEGLPVPAPPPPPAPAPAAPGGDPAPSAADRRCAQARATLRLREKALRAARRRRATRANRRLVARRAAARRIAQRDVRRRCA